jgi:dihydrodipicolinate synthase/N-acetylneuraminate lyase
MPTEHAASGDPLWVPLLTHFRRDGTRLAVDTERMTAQIRAMQPDVRQFLLAGSTGDGWEIGLDQLMDIVHLTRRADVFGGTRILFGVLRRTTEEVVAWGQAVERALDKDGPPAGAYMGLTVCPPVQPDATQETILAHYRAVLAATQSPIAVYQLPQVTGCSIAPATMRAIAENPRVTMFKDTSGTDTVAGAGPLPGVLMVRGAEGGYVEALKPAGPYDGWLLSTGNVFGRALRRMLELHSAGEAERARALSTVVSAMVDALFQAAVKVGFGNPFSNANRAADHVRAFGRDWRSAPLPLAASGNALPVALLEAAADIIGALPGIPEGGYVARFGPEA